MKFNSSVGCLGISASPLCAFYRSNLQKTLSTATVKILCSQINYLRLLQSFGSTIRFYLCPASGEFNVSIAVFCDAGHVASHVQRSYLAGILIGPSSELTKFNNLSWSSHESNRTVKSIGVSKILATSESIDEGKGLNSVCRRYFKFSFK